MITSSNEIQYRKEFKNEKQNTIEKLMRNENTVQYKTELKVKDNE